jgi:hypothetical protein
VGESTRSEDAASMWEEGSSFAVVFQSSAGEFRLQELMQSLHVLGLDSGCCDALAFFCRQEP